MKSWKLSLGMTAILVLLSGCDSRTANIQLQKTNAQQTLLIQQQQAQIDALKEALDKPKTQQVPKKNIKLKEVEDDNYSSAYMYPGETKKKKIVKVASVAPPTKNVNSNTIGKSECIAMIGEDKFNKYTQMFGSEAASVKRCNMLKAMR